MDSYGLWGNGFAAILGEHFPSSKKDYEEYANNKLGDVLYSRPNDNIIIAHMFGQTVIKSIQYLALAQAMQKIANLAWLNIGKTDYNTSPAYEIHATKFGSDLSRGNWAFIEALIEEIWINNDIKVYVYEV